MQISVVKSECVESGFQQTIQSAPKGESYTQCDGRYVQPAQRVFGADIFESNLDLKGSFVSIGAWDDGKGNRPLAAKMLLLFPVEVIKNCESDEEGLAFL